MSTTFLRSASVSAIAAVSMAACMISPLTALALTVNSATEATVNTDVSGAVASTSAGASVDATASTEGTTNTSADSQTTSTSGVTLDVNASGVAVNQPAQVASDSDLSVYTSNLSKTHTEVRSVDTSASDRVRVMYTHAGRFFGIFPVSVTSETDVSVDAQGKTTIETHMPWWNMFVTGTHEVESKVAGGTLFSTSLAANFSANATAAQRAQIIDEIVKAHESLDAGVQAAANVQTTTSY